MTETWDKARKTGALESMLMIRRFEETIVRLFQEEAFMAHYHLYIGQEATGVGVMEALGPDDKLATHHRNHGHMIARGADPGKAVAEILGRKDGLNHGHAGTLHMSEPDLGFISTSAIVGGSISLATGAAFALKQQGGDAVAVGLFGDGALEEGVSYESLNFAALYSLPAVYVCENNSPGALGSAGGGFPTSVSAVKDLVNIPQTFDIPFETVDGRDLDAIYELTSRAVDHCRRREGPFFIHAVTDRYAGSQALWPDLPTGQTDVSMGWDESRMEGEHEGWFQGHDPVMIYARRLLGEGDITQEELAEIDKRVSGRLDEAREFALASSPPAAETALDNVFA
jgi:acetoin:2,6-dichlorophenolindophenol oxidoreductase subunit alpha